MPAHLIARDHVPVEKLLEALAPAAIALMREQLRQAATDDLISQVAVARRKGKRLPFFFLNVELSSRGIAPCFRQWELSDPERLGALPTTALIDLIMQDLIWLASASPERRMHDDPWQPQTWRRAVLTTAKWSRKGRPEAWLMTKLLKLSEREQWSCRILQSKPVRLRHMGLHQSSQHIWAKLAETMPAIRRTGADEVTALQVIARRKKLWFAAESCGWSPTETARVFKSMRGDELTRAAVAKQLCKIEEFKRKRPQIPDEENHQEEGNYYAALQT